MCINVSLMYIYVLINLVLQLYVVNTDMPYSFLLFFYISVLSETYYQKHTAPQPTSRARVPCVLRLLRTNKYACMVMSCLIHMVIQTRLSILSLCVCYLATIYTSRELTCSTGQLLLFTSTTPAYYRVTSIYSFTSMMSQSIVLCNVS